MEEKGRLNRQVQEENLKKIYVYVYNYIHGFSPTQQDSQIFEEKESRADLADGWMEELPQVAFDLVRNQRLAPGAALTCRKCGTTLSGFGRW